MQAHEYLLTYSPAGSVHLSNKQLRDIWDLYTIPHSDQDNKNVIDKSTLFVLLTDVFELLLKKREIPVPFLHSMSETYGISVHSDIVNVG